MNIVPMHEDHVPQVALLEKACFADPWSEKSIAFELTNPLSLWLVAQEGDTLLGYVGSQTCLNETDMMNIAIPPAFRHQGVACWGLGLRHAILRANLEVSPLGDTGLVSSDFAYLCPGLTVCGSLQQ